MAEGKQAEGRRMHLESMYGQAGVNKFSCQESHQLSHQIIQTTGARGADKEGWQAK